ncbi:MAG TPA: Cu+ exporting ATPase, partial [Halomonas sp.]|nr:Cu+ exporting ATPase [Halomonas sp.]
MQHDTEQTVMLIRTVPGMNCQGCVKRMREAIQAQDPAAQVEGFPAEKRLEVTSSLDDQALDSALNEAGYPPSDDASDAPHPDAPEPAESQSAPVDAPQLRLLISG